MRFGNLEHGELLRRFARGIKWRVGPFSVSVTTSLPQVARELAFLYRDFSILADDTIVHAEIAVRASGITRRQASIFSDGNVVFRHVPYRQIVPLLEWTLNLSVFHRPSALLLLHAAVVEKKGRAVVLPGAAGSGKSTLCAALIHRGWRLLSDEVAVVRPLDGLLLPAPRPVSLKEGSIDAVKRLAPEAVLGPIWEETAKGRLAHVVPPAESARRMDEPAEPAWIIFPNYRAQTETQLVPISKAQTQMECADHGFNYSVLGQDGFCLLARMVDTCECYELPYNNLVSAVDKIESLAEPSDSKELVRLGSCS